MTSNTDELPFTGTNPDQRRGTGQRAKNAFMTDAASSLKALRRAQRTRLRRDQRARARFEQAQARLRWDLESAAAIESAGWRTLLDVPGITVATAAALTGTSPATIRRRLKEAGLAD